LNQEGEVYTYQIAFTTEFVLTIESRGRSFLTLTTPHYGQRLRVHWFIPMKLQETKSLASQPFILKAKVQQQSSYMAVFFDLIFDQRPKPWTLEGSLGRTGIETQTMIKRSLVFLIKI